MDNQKYNFLTGFIRMCDDGYRLGWHEGCGGSLSYRMRNEEVRAVRENLSFDRQWLDIGADVPGLGGEYFLITAANKYFKNIAGNPSGNTVIIEIDEDGERYRVLNGLADAAPSSYLHVHLTAHEVKKQATNDSHKVVYFCHAPNIIALTFKLELTSEAFTRELYKFHPDCRTAFKNGIGIIEPEVFASRDIVAAIFVGLKEWDAEVLAHRGLIVSGEDFDMAFGLAQTVEKAAEIAVKVISMGGKV